MDFDDIVKIVDQVKVLEARLAVAEAEREKYQGLADNRLNCMALYRDLIGKHEARIGVLADKLNLAEAERDAALKRAAEARETADNYAGHCGEACKQLEAVEAERDAARAEVERLRESLRKIAAATNQLGPDRASSQYMAEQAHGIASAFLANAEPGGGLTNQDHVWQILDDVLLLLAGQYYPTPERTYKLDGGWSLALADLKRCLADLRAKVALAEAERDAARAGEARAVEEARKARAWEARTSRLYKRAIKALRYMQQYQEEKGAGTALSILVAMEDIDDVLQLADNELGRHVDESLAWLAQQRREAAAEENDRWANEWWEFPRPDSLTASDFITRAAALRAGEVLHG